MCGLVGLLSKKNKSVGQQVYNIYAQQKHRGQQGYGYIGINHQREIVSIQRTKTEAEIRKLLMKEQAPIIMFHHRLPTSTKNTLGTTHPIFVSNALLDHDYYFAHNGVITNKDTLKTKHEKLGFEYTTEFVERSFIEYNDGRTEEPTVGASTFNDSESLAIELAMYCDGHTDEVDTTGAAAFWGIQVDKESGLVNKIYYGKNSGRDLKITSNKKYWGISSEKGSNVEDMKLFTIDLANGDATEKDLPINDYIKVVTNATQTRVGYGYGGYYPHDKDNFFLENKEYTREEAVDSGAPLSEFFSEEKSYGRIYVPIKYASLTGTRKSLLQTEVSVPLLPTPKQTSLESRQNEKTMIRLEELCGEIAEWEVKRDNLDMMYQTGRGMDEAYYRGKVREYDNKIQANEAIISTLGVTEEQVDEMMDLSRQLVDYNLSFSEEMEYIQFA